MASDRLMNLMNDHENAVSRCASDSAKYKGCVGIDVLSKVIVTRMTLVREVTELERLTDLWRSARSANGIEEGD